MTPNTAWKLEHRLMQVMMERYGRRLTSRVEMVGCPYSEWRTSCSRRTRPRRTKQNVDHSRYENQGHKGQQCAWSCARSNSFRRKEVESQTKRSLDPESAVVSNDLLASAADIHKYRMPRIDPIRAGSAHTAVPPPAFT